MLPTQTACLATCCNGIGVTVEVLYNVLYDDVTCSCTIKDLIWWGIKLL